MPAKPRHNNANAASPVIVLFRRDLRLADHPALAAAAETGQPVIPVYILDDESAGSWKLGGASRWWLHQSLTQLTAALERLGSRLVLRRGETVHELHHLADETGARSVTFTRGYEPFQRALEERMHAELGARGIDVRRFGGHTLFEPEKLLNKSHEPFRVYTPFFRAVMARDVPNAPLPAPDKLPHPQRWPDSLPLDAFRLEPKTPDWAGGLRAAWTCGEAAAHERLRVFIDTMVHDYGANRNTPGMDGTSRLSPHLAFGEISPRQVWHAVRAAADASGKHDQIETYAKEIVWREFSYHLLFHFPHLPDRAFKREFDAFPWGPQERSEFHAWSKGRTGYPIVDAGMRQLWQTGWMHNRVRMITASFLIKHLLVPWQEGQAWFWDTLVDADLASNSASWQWVAGSGADAAPYFRIFNPVLQGEKFDPDGAYVRAYCPELSRLPNAVIHKPWEADASVLAKAGVVLGKTYPQPMVVHAEARKRALAAYQRLG
jgi:deoxyribodipyrimidine photo-lyase